MISNFCYKPSTINHQLILVGTNHKYSPIQIREQLSFSKRKIKDALISLVGFKEIRAGIILSTCNRVELYASSLDTEAAIMALKKFLSVYHLQDLSKLTPYLYTYIGKEAIFHLFNVASGLDSQIIGESQILEQVRFAYCQAKEIEATDRLLDLVFDNAIRVSLKVRQETGISKGKVSIASVVSEVIKTECGCIKDKKILIIGAGKISELVTSYLKKEKVKIVFIANRTYERACHLAESIDAEVVRFDRLKEKLLDTDIIISATSSPHLILKKEDFLDIKKPLLVIDLALPRDVDPEVKNIKDISLFGLDDLDFVIEKNLNERRQSIPAAEEIIRKEVENLCLTENLAFRPSSILMVSEAAFGG